MFESGHSGLVFEEIEHPRTFHPLLTKEKGSINPLFPLSFGACGVHKINLSN
jgi:hypothetical protein